MLKKHAFHRLFENSFGILKTCRIFVSNKQDMETLTYTYYAKGREINVSARQTWDGDFAINYNTPNGYPRRKEFATAKECIKAFNRMTNNQTK